MSKIFRLYKEGPTTYQDWNASSSFPYNSSNRDSIEDPDGASAKNEITSIPSPFARIDLVKNAFRQVCKQDRITNRVNLDGQSIFHKMVSDTLDVAEIFFNLDKFQDKIEVIKWERPVMLSELAESDLVGHQYLADVLNKYMISDAPTYNFNKLKNIYLLNYINGPDEINIIGATSPATLFFSNADDLSYVKDIYLGLDKPFDSDYNPLYKRDFEFVKYLFALRKSIPSFAALFPEVDEYLGETFKQITDLKKKNELINVDKNTLETFDTITVHDVQQNDLVEVLDFPLYKKSKRPIGSSDFVIKSQYKSNIRPLVLPVDAGNRYSALQYTTDGWGTTNKAPFVDAQQNLNLRKLPFDGTQYPYLTISDFLEETILRVPYILNDDHYFNGHINVDNPKFSYLLPLKPLFFEFFTIENLKGKLADGKEMFEMTLLAGDSVSVTLRIPIAGKGNVSYIEYNRIYYNNSTSDISLNQGNIVEIRFTGFIMPQVKFINPENAIYNISCVQASSSKNEFIFYSEGKKIQPDSKTCRNQEQELLIQAENYYLTGKSFDFIQVKDHYGNKGLMIPIFKQQRNVETFEFAIDLGTTNTHIEYRKGEENPQVFSFDSHDRQLCEMFIPMRDESGALSQLQEQTEMLEKDFIPGEIGNGDFHFPTRTVLSSAKIVDWKETVEPFTLVNIPFTYDKREDLRYNNLKYNIKWGEGDELRIMEAYVNNLMLIIRNKVLLNNGDLNKTKVTWFYPLSMPPKRFRKLKDTWDDAYVKYFGEGSTNHMTESYAPIQYFINMYSTATSLINIDIGGGTTDIAFAKDRSIVNVTSFRFASNSLFEDSFSELNHNNGIVDWHKNEILSLLKEKNIYELIRVFNSANNSHPSNMASFLFGLKENTLLKKAGIHEGSIDFNYILREDENFKIVFIVFYTAIIYHIAQLVKTLGLEVPRHISFSGNGSKIIRVITTDTKVLSNYTKLIFEKVLNMPYGKDLELLGLEKDTNPKDSTCKGGLLDKEKEDNKNKIVVFKSNGSGIIDKFDTYATISDKYKDNTIKAVADFFKFLFEDLGSSFNFDKNFGVTSSSLKIAQEVSTKDLATFLDKGLKQHQKREQIEPDDIIEETFFFYPIKGVIQTISNEILKSLKNES